MGAGDAARPDAERRRAGPPLGSGRGPMRAAPAAEARADDPARGDAAGAAVDGARASPSACPPAARARSRHRPVGSPSDPS